MAGHPSRPHRYVHGGFEGTHTLFSFYFPPAEECRGRFFQYLEGGSGGHETLIATQRWIYTMAFDDLGGYLVESNQGHYPNEGMGFANDRELFGASAESALFAKTLAVESRGAALREPKYLRRYALEDFGVELYDLPITPERVWTALRGATTGTGPSPDRLGGSREGSTGHGRTS